MFGNLRRADHDGVNVSRWGDPWKVARASDQGGQDSVKRRHSRSRLPIGGRLLLVGAVTLAALVGTMSAASAAGGQWKLGSYTAKGGFSFKGAGTGAFIFPTAPTAALLVTSQKALIGNDTTKTITATFTVTDPANNFIYGGEPSCGGLPATVRLYFDDKSILSSTGAPTDYWWSNPYSVVLTDGQWIVSATIDSAGANWSDYNGQFGNVDSATTAAFLAAAANVQDIGLSFGGGCFFANGVGAPDGLGTFTLNTYTVVSA
jgi:hypothetical protein